MAPQHCLLLLDPVKLCTLHLSDTHILQAIYIDWQVTLWAPTRTFVQVIQRVNGHEQSLVSYVILLLCRKPSGSFPQSNPEVQQKAIWVLSRIFRQCL